MSNQKTPTVIKTENASRVLQLMDSYEDAPNDYSKFVKSVSEEQGISIEQLEKELEDFI
jgi:ribosome-binding protein aMBF1 (putative translation factor)